MCLLKHSGHDAEETPQQHLWGAEKCGTLLRDLPKTFSTKIFKQKSEIGVSHHFEFWLTPPGVLEHPGACTGPVGGGITNRVQCNVFFPESAMRDVESVQQLIHCEVDRAAFNEKEKIWPLQNQDWTATRVENEPRQWVGSV